MRLPRLIGLWAAVPLVLGGSVLSSTKALKAGVIDSVLAEDTSVYPEDNDSYIVNQIATCVVMFAYQLAMFRRCTRRRICCASFLCKPHCVVYAAVVLFDVSKWVCSTYNFAVNAGSSQRGR